MRFSPLLTKPPTTRSKSKNLSSKLRSISSADTPASTSSNGRPQSPIIQIVNKLQTTLSEDTLASTSSNGQFQSPIIRLKALPLTLQEAKPLILISFLMSNQFGM